MLERGRGRKKERIRMPVSSRVYEKVCYPHSCLYSDICYLGYLSANMWDSGGGTGVLEDFISADILLYLIAGKSVEKKEFLLGQHQREKVMGRRAAKDCGWPLRRPVEAVSEDRW